MDIDKMLRDAEKLAELVDPPDHMEAVEVTADNIEDFMIQVARLEVQNAVNNTLNHVNEGSPDGYELAPTGMLKVGVTSCVLLEAMQLFLTSVSDEYKGATPTSRMTYALHLCETAKIIDGLARKTALDWLKSEKK